MVQEVIIALIFIAALVYLGRLIYRSFAADTGCPKGCGSCGTVDFEKIKRELEERERAG